MSDRSAISNLQNAAEKTVRANTAESVAESESASSLMALGQSLGNRALGKLIQAKLRVGSPNDPQEREADRFADRLTLENVPRRAVRTVPAASPEDRVRRKCAACEKEEEERPRRKERPGGGPIVRRKCAKCREEDEEKARRKEAGGAETARSPASFETRVGALRGGGQPLETWVRDYFEPRLDRRLGDVRIHDGPAAARTSQSINARAFTLGRDIFFDSGEYSPGSRSGRRLLAHELAHVVQQTPTTDGEPVARRQAEPENAAEPENRDESDESPEPQAEPVPGEGDGEAAGEGRSAPAKTAAAGLIVDDDAEDVGTDQMRKSVFLAELREAVCSAADEGLAGSGRDSQGCPWIEMSLRFYERQSAQRIEADLLEYVPEASGASSAREYLPPVVARVRRSVAVWVRTGQVTGVPKNLPGKGAIGALSGFSGLATGLGALFFQGRRGGARGHNADPLAVRSRLGGGRPLEGGVRSRMESAFGHGFSEVRVHDDAAAASLSGDFNARAFTVGEHVAFAPGEYRPGTLAGDALIAHELAHVHQQDGARASFETMPQNGADAGQALEADANRSAALAVASTLGAGKNLGGRAKAAPRLRAGLSLRGCDCNGKKKVEAPTPQPPARPTGPTTGSGGLEVFEEIGSTFCDVDKGKMTWKVDPSKLPLCMVDCATEHELDHVRFREKECAKVVAVWETVKTAIDEADAAIKTAQSSGKQEDLEKAEKAAGKLDAAQKAFESAVDAYAKWFRETCKEDEKRAYQTGIDKCKEPEIVKLCKEMRDTERYTRLMSEWERFKDNPPNCL